jgi:hypothetical protein
VTGHPVQEKVDPELAQIVENNRARTGYQADQDKVEGPAAGVLDGVGAVLADQPLDTLF